MSDKIDLKAICEDETEVAFCALRGRAIQEYAHLEQHLLVLFASLTGQKVREAAVIFFNLRLSNTLFQIFDGLIALRYEKKYDDIWEPLSQLLGQLTDMRNCIVHWLDVTNISSSDREFVLMPAKSFWAGSTPQMPQMKTAEQIFSFIHKCNLVSSYVHQFAMALAPNAVNVHGQDLVDSWLDKCREAATHPDMKKPRSPRGPKTARPETPPESSQT